MTTPAPLAAVSVWRIYPTWLQWTTILGVALRQLDGLEGEIAELDAEILRTRRLSTLTAIILLAEIGDIAWFDSSKQLAA